jgi:hypothetical protein
VKLSPHFELEELISGNMAPENLSAQVLGNLKQLADTLLEPIRDAIGKPLRITSGLRSLVHQKRLAASGVGAKVSDHTTGRAADFQVTGRSWREDTQRAFTIIPTLLNGHFGQLIYEDHRAFRNNPDKLWVHIAIPSSKHPGTAADPSRILVSREPGIYIPYREGMPL